MTNKVLIITGPTASGKSDFAIKLAKKFDGEIISADSQQIYKDMDIGTNKITEFEMDGICHYGLDIKYPNEDYSVQEFKDMARTLIDQINSKGKLPIIAGGTGFYIDSILFDLNYGTSKKDENLRKELTDLANIKGNEYIYKKLIEIDPIEAKKYHPNEVQRIIRALETFELTGEKPSDLRIGFKKLNENISPILFFINYNNRSKLYDRINERVDQMFAMGLEDEFKNLLNEYKLDSKSKSLQAIGYKEFFPYIDSEISFDTLVSEIKKNTRRYAKRQITRMKKYLDYNFSHLFYRDEKSDKEILSGMDKIIKETYDL
ncbi:MAG: tRNA (adenosine(37)-N6)-dimethylallyltransferase MiaA [Anaerococcus vaginalis]|nr:tRNA (adenosine(37)-N6)-dimethylallyltransferase MiaA [Anaerococcus vaginalis]MDU6065082.1 tRNA (adenosine(37)-N6)-dimethylallyltransferase MiaA [Anaerococcus sp.]